MALLRSVVFWLGFTADTVAYFLVAFLLIPFPFIVRYRVVNSWTCLNRWWLEKTCGVRYVVEGRENLPPGNGVVFSKHQSTWETLALPCLFPVVTPVLKRELLRVPFFGWGLALLEPVAIDRKAGRKALEQLVDQGRARLAAGRWVLVFPEGTRVAPGTKGKYRKGGAVLAARTGYPVIPIAHNAGDFWPRHQFVKLPGTIRVCIGPVIESRGRSAEEILAEAEAWIEAKMAEIQPAAS